MPAHFVGALFVRSAKIEDEAAFSIDPARIYLREQKSGMSLARVFVEAGRSPVRDCRRRLRLNASKEA